jgi:hypothetical protein
MGFGVGGGIELLLAFSIFLEKKRETDFFAKKNVSV